MQKLVDDPTMAILLYTVSGLHPHHDGGHTQATGQLRQERLESPWLLLRRGSWNRCQQPRV
eukprot:8866273-Pyramimonas_sp.AAC.1